MFTCGQDLSAPQKGLFRAEAARRLAAIPEDEIRRGNARIAARVLSHPAYLAAKTVFIDHFFVGMPRVGVFAGNGATASPHADLEAAVALDDNIDVNLAKADDGAIDVGIDIGVGKRQRPERWFRGTF